MSAPLPDIQDYNGELLAKLLVAVDKLGAHILTPDQYQAEVGAIFQRHPPVTELHPWTKKALAEQRDQVLYRRSRDGRSVWFQLLYLAPNEVHYPHGHGNLISNQVLLHGQTFVREYDRVTRLSPDRVLLKPRSDRRMIIGDRIRSTNIDRDVHWFAASDAPAVQLNFFVAGYQEWTFDGPGHPGRTYFDPTAEEQSDGLILARQISPDEAERLFKGKAISSFQPPRRYVRAA